MPWNSGTYTRSDGTYSGATVWADNAAAGIDIVTSHHDPHDQDLATGINTCLTKDGQNTATANLPMGGFRHTNVGTAQASTQYASAGEVQKNTYNYAGTATGTTGTSYSISPFPAITALTPGMKFLFVAPVANTGSAELVVGTAGTAYLTYADGSTKVPASGIGSGGLYEVTYTNQGGGAFQVTGLYQGGAFTNISVSGIGTVGTLSVTGTGTSAGTHSFNALTAAGASITGVGTVGTLSVTGTGTSAGTHSFNAITSVSAAVSGLASAGTISVSTTGTYAGTQSFNAMLANTLTVGTLSVTTSPPLKTIVGTSYTASTGTVGSVSGAAYYFVRMAGAGAAGGGTTAANRGCGGGGAGGYAEVWLTAAQVGTGLPFAVGTAGAQLSFGGTTILAGIGTCTGGQAGEQNNASTNQGGTGGIASVGVGSGIITRTGQKGSFGANSSLAIGGKGGDNAMGNGGAMIVGPDTSFSGAGNNASGYGAGGGGAVVNAGGGTATGGVITVVAFAQ